MTVLVCGLSRVGKTSSLQSMGEGSSDYRYISASSILRSKGMPTEGISIREAVFNQDVITSHLVDRYPEKFLVDGHILLETIDGPFLVPESSINKWRLGGIIFVTESASLISTRRVASERSSSECEIELLFRIELLYAKYISEKLGIKFAEIKAANTSAIQRFLQEI